MIGLLAVSTTPAPLALNPRLLSLLGAALVGLLVLGPLLIAFIRARLRRGQVPPVADSPIILAPGDASPDVAASEREEDPLSPERRRFLSRVGVAVAGFGATLVAVPALAFLVAPLRRTDRTIWRTIGTLEQFPIGATVQVEFVDPAPLEWAGFAAQTAAWVRRQDETEFVAFSAYCTHVGCPVRWLEEAELFLCPCHGGAFDRDGSVAAGPPPRPLNRYPVRVRGDQVEIQPQPILRTGL